MKTKICGCTTETCGCCEGIQKLTPQTTANRPGLNALNYRVGTHGAFLETMKARLSTMIVGAPGADGQTIETFAPLLGLTTRDTGDFSIALLDGWATVADVLTFYQERIANEGYLRTATARRSVLELARLTGYALRPGVAATVYLAYTIDEDRSVTPPKRTVTTIPKGSRAQSVPGPGELPQTFETSEDIEARSVWNALQPRMTRPQTRDSIDALRLFLSGIATNLQPNDPLLIDFGDGKAPTPYRVKQVVADATNNRTQVMLQLWVVPQTEQLETKSPAIDWLDTILRSSLELPPSIPPPNALQLLRSPRATFTKKADVFPRLLATLRPRLSGTLHAVLQNAAVTAPQPIKVYALRAKAAPFGNNAPRKITGIKPDPQGDKPAVTTEEWDTDNMRHAGEKADRIYLDASYEKVLPHSWMIIDTSAVNGDQLIGVTKIDSPVIAQAKNPNAHLSRAVYGISGKTTSIKLVDNQDTSTKWFDYVTPEAASGHDFQIIRRTAVYAQSERLALAEEPIEDDVCDGKANWIELDSLYADLESGRWAIVSGERADITIPDPNDSTKRVSVPGVKASELMMLTDVIHDVSTEDGEPSSEITTGKSEIRLPQEKLHTFVRFAKPLSYCYRRDTLIIYGNVSKATHGETRNETLGNGDGSQALQSFALKQPPLTFVPASNPKGVDSTLEVFVNDVQWHEADSLASLSPQDRKFITKTDNDGKTSVIFGSGEKGARLPTGMVNVKAVYRNGIGKPGNVKAEQISLLQTRPLGVKSVLNPLPASGGADAENRDQARENAPLAVMSLDRLVSVQDYADFTRTFAGIGKAAARELSDSKRQLVHVTIAGANDIPIETTSDLYQNLVAALRRFGDPDLPVQVQLRELMVLVLSAKVRLATDYQWEPVVTEIRVALLHEFGFQKRALGQPVLLSEIISVIQNIPGVEYVDVDAFGGIPEKTPELDASGKPTGKRKLLTLEDIATTVGGIVDAAHLAPRVDVNLADFENGALRPAQLAIFTEAVPDTLILNQIR